MRIVVSIHHHQLHHHPPGPHHYHLLRHRPHLIHIRFKCSVRADWRCRRCVVTIIIKTVGDAKDAS